MAPEREAWVEAAEALLGQVTRLLEGNRTALVEALTRDHGREPAEAMLNEIERYVEALELHVWRAGTLGRDRRSVVKIGQLISRGLLVVGTGAGLYLTEGLHQELMAARQAAQVVIVECGGVPEDSDSLSAHGLSRSSGTLHEPGEVHEPGVVQEVGTATEQEEATRVVAAQDEIRVQADQPRLDDDERTPATYDDEASTYDDEETTYDE